MNDLECLHKILIRIERKIDFLLEMMAENSIEFFSDLDKFQNNIDSEQQMDIRQIIQIH